MNSLELTGGKLFYNGMFDNEADPVGFLRPEFPQGG